MNTAKVKNFLNVNERVLSSRNYFTRESQKCRQIVFFRVFSDIQLFPPFFLCWLLSLLNYFTNFFVSKSHKIINSFFMVN